MKTFLKKKKIVFLFETENRQVRIPIDLTNINYKNEY